MCSNFVPASGGSENLSRPGRPATAITFPPPSSRHQRANTGTTTILRHLNQSRSGSHTVGGPEFLTVDGQDRTYVIPAEQCQEDIAVMNITDTNATIYIMNFVSKPNVTDYNMRFAGYCTFVIGIPAGLYMRVTVDDLPDVSCTDAVVEITDALLPDLDMYATNYRECFAGKNNLIYPRSRRVVVKFIPNTHGKPGKPWFGLHFHATKTDGALDMPLVCTSNASGVIMSSFTQAPYAAGLNMERVFSLHYKRSMLISFSLLEIGKYPTDKCPPHDDTDYLSLSTARLANGINTHIFRKCECKLAPSLVFTGFITLEFYTDMLYTNLGFAMLFSFHERSHILRHYMNNMFKCDTQYYSSDLKRHLECNMEVECEGGEDEKDCLYAHPACDGSVGYRDRCYKRVTSSSDMTWDEADSECRASGGRLATLKTAGERQEVSKFFIYGKQRWLFYVGARLYWRQPAPNMTQYRRLWSWVDGTVAYDFNISIPTRGLSTLSGGAMPDCAYLDPILPGTLFLYYCGNEKVPLYGKILIQSYICEYQNGEKLPEAKIELPKISTPFKHSLTRCLDGHMTMDFLSCHADNHCGLNASQSVCRVAGSGEMPKYPCENEREFVPYTLVCDYRQDCQDASDERFCMHMPCDDRSCRNKQCVTSGQWCDRMKHCVDGTDERRCYYETSDALPEIRTGPAPLTFDLDWRGGVTRTPIHPSQPCPETHFRCPGNHTYCLPVYLRCNGVYDCPYHEDEAECHLYSCPGFYRCRASLVCVHPKLMCDGVFHCPYQDDEWRCDKDRSCPDGCRCQGLAFVCSRPFSTGHNLDLRYLDASGSGTTPSQLTSLHYLVRLVLASCGLVTINSLVFPNLRQLDLSDNKIASVNYDSVVGLENLRSLILAGNQLSEQTVTPATLTVYHTNLRHLDLSRSNIEKFDSKVLSSFRRLSTLIISNSTLTTIGENSFKYLPNLVQLDIRNSPVEQFPSDVFSDLHYLKSVWTDNYKLCCPETLPVHFESGGCHAPMDEISSCEDLLRSDVYRACLWVFAALSILGNAGSFLIRLFNKRSASKTGYNVFVTNLSVADCLMGVYLVMIGIADHVYRGKYLWHESTWKRSVACEMAGFLSLLSSEMSALIICLITLDRFIVLRFPFSTLYFRRWSAMVTCAVLWGVGLAMAAIPLLPSVSHWEFYSQSGICVPLPITRKSFKGRNYSFGVVIVLNFVLFLLVAVGQFFVYWSVRFNLMTSDTSKKSQDATIARRLITVAVSDFLCWFPIGLLGLLASRGTPIPGEVNVGMAIFVLPLNSALNPFLYTFNMLMERRRKNQEKDMLAWFTANILTRKQATPPNATATSADIDNVLLYLKQRLEDKMMTYQDLMAQIHTPARE